MPSTLKKFAKFVEKVTGRTYDTEELSRAIIVAKQQASSIAKKLDEQGGEMPGEGISPVALARADFVTFPENIEGATCANCIFKIDNGDKTICTHPVIFGQPVTDRNCCIFWSGPGTLRHWSDMGYESGDDYAKDLKSQIIKDSSRRPLPPSEDDTAQTADPIDPELWQQCLSAANRHTDMVDGLQVVWVEASKVKIADAMDFIEGSNGYVREFIPKDQIWIDTENASKNWPFVIYHETFEVRLLKSGETYEEAHLRANAAERVLRMQGIKKSKQLPPRLDLVTSNPPVIPNLEKTDPVSVNRQRGHDIQLIPLAGETSAQILRDGKIVYRSRSYKLPKQAMEDAGHWLDQQFGTEKQSEFIDQNESGMYETGIEHNRTKLPNKLRNSPLYISSDTTTTDGKDREANIDQRDENTFSPETKSSYFEDCPRDEHGRCLPSGQTGTSVGEPASAKPNRDKLRRTFMSSTPIATLAEFPSGFGEVYLVQFKGKEKGVFKVEIPPDDLLRKIIGGGSLSKREGAASAIANVIGLNDLVPLTVERRQPINGKYGSIQHYIPNTTSGNKLEESKMYGSSLLDVARAAAFDYIIGNRDRHPGNWLVTPQGKLVLIDNGASLAYEDLTTHPYRHSLDLDPSFMAEDWLLSKSYAENLHIPTEVESWDWDAIADALRTTGIGKVEISGAKRRFDQLRSSKDFHELNSKDTLNGHVWGPNQEQQKGYWGDSIQGSDRGANNDEEDDTFDQEFEDFLQNHNLNVGDLGNADMMIIGRETREKGSSQPLHHPEEVGDSPLKENGLPRNYPTGKEDEEEEEVPEEEEPQAIAIDFDGTIADHEDKDGEDNDLGEQEPRKGVKEALNRFWDAGLKIIVWTSREDLDEVADWMDDYKLPYDDVNNNTEQDNNSRKIKADVYIDNRAVPADIPWKDITDAVFNKLGRKRYQRTKHLIITGSSGAGKTYLSKKVSKATGLPIHHLDNEEDWSAGGILKDDPDRFKKGTASYTRFRKLLKRVIRKALSRKHPHILEGCQFLLHPGTLRGHDILLIDADEDTVVRQRLQRDGEYGKLRGDNRYVREGKARDLYYKWLPYIDRMKAFPEVNLVTPEELTAEKLPDWVSSFSKKKSLARRVVVKGIPNRLTYKPDPIIQRYDTAELLQPYNREPDFQTQPRSGEAKTAQGGQTLEAGSLTSPIGVGFRENTTTQAGLKALSWVSAMPKPKNMLNQIVQEFTSKPSDGITEETEKALGESSGPAGGFLTNEEVPTKTEENAQTW